MPDGAPGAADARMVTGAGLGVLARVLKADRNGLSAYQAMIASAVWSGFGLAAVVALYCRHFLAPEPSGRGRRWPRMHP